MPLFRWCLGVVLLLVMSLFLSKAANAQEASIEDIILTNDESDLILYLTVANSFSSRLEQAVLNGMPVTVQLTVNLYKKHRFWPDDLIEGTQVSHSIQYDLLKKEFHVKLDERKQTNHTVRDFYEAKRLMADLDRFSIISMDRLEKKREYYLRIKAKLLPLRPPFYLDFFFFFLPKWEFETSWVVKEFIY